MPKNKNLSRCTQDRLPPKAIAFHLILMESVMRIVFFCDVAVFSGGLSGRLPIRHIFKMIRQRSGAVAARVSVKMRGFKNRYFYGVFKN